MKYSLLLVAIMIAIFNFTNVEAKENKMADDIYAFKVKTITGDEISLSEYKGKVLLIVNTASKCGFTNQYKGLQELYDKYKDQGFAVLGFPCNQFGAQEPGTKTEIKEFCEINYNITFPMFDKIDVNGDNASPLYIYLKANAPGFLNDAIKWNFSKFLVGKDGKVVNRYASQKTPVSIQQDIEELLK